MIRTAGTGKAAKNSGTAKQASKGTGKMRGASYRGAGDSSSSVVIHIADEPEMKREIPIPDDIEEVRYDFEADELYQAVKEEKTEDSPKAAVTKETEKAGRRTEKQKTSGKAKDGKKKKHGFVKILAAAVLLLAAAFGAFCFYIHSYYKVTNYISDRQVPENLNAERLLADEGWEPLSAAETDALRADASAARKNAAALPAASRNVRNILLVVLDRKDNDYYGSTDGIVLASVNTAAKKINFYPLRTDLYAEIPGHGVGRIGDATVYGGCPLLVRTIADTYGIPVVNYLSTDMKGLIGMINEAGGIPMKLEGEDKVALNVKIKELAAADGADPESWYLTESAGEEANGYQAAASVLLNQDEDERIGRVMEALFRKIGANETGTRLKKILPYTSHNLPMGAVVSGIPSLAGIFGFGTTTTVIPPEDMLSRAKGIIVPEFDRFLAFLAEALSGEADEEAAEESAASTASTADTSEEDSTGSAAVTPEDEIPEPKITPAVPWALAPAV